MEFEWDNKKYARNLEKHGISFRVGMQLLTSGDFYEGDSKHSELEEERFLATGLVEGQYLQEEG